MEPRDDLDSFGGGVECAACGVAVPTERIRVLARRQDIAFVEIHCPSCRSESLGIVIEGAEEGDDDGDGTGIAVGPGLAYGEFGPDDAARFHDASPIGRADVDRVHDLLARGGLAALVDGYEPPSAGSSR